MLSIPSPTSILSALLSGLPGLLGLILATVIRRIYYHPLAHIPGPKLAAATLLYQTYYSFAHGGSRFYKRIEQLHDQYGRVIRIAPNEIHLSDPENYDEIYHVGTRYSKDPLFYEAFGNPNSMITTASNELHRMRRGAVSPFFSRKVVLSLEDIVHEKAKKFSDLVENAMNRGATVDMHHGLRAVSIDIVTEYAFGKCYDLLDTPDLGLKFFTLMHKIGPAAWVFRQWPWLKAFTMIIPEKAVKALSEPMGQVRDMQNHCRQLLREVNTNMKDATEQVKPRPTMFSTLLAAGKQTDNAMTDNAADEAYTVLTAAADNTGNAMAAIARYIVSDADIYRKLHMELKVAFPERTEKLDFTSLDKLPYLTNVIKEGLRLAFSVPGRLPRVVPDPGAQFNSYVVPAGTVVSMSAWMLHLNEDYFPNPTKFDPDRWSDPKAAQKMEKAFVPFSKGSRACIGMVLAYCELYVTIGTLFRRFENLKGNDLSSDDLVYDDYFSSYNPLSAKKFHVMAADTV